MDKSCKPSREVLSARKLCLLYLLLCSEACYKEVASMVMWHITSFLISLSLFFSPILPWVYSS